MPILELGFDLHYLVFVLDLDQIDANTLFVLSELGKNSDIVQLPMLCFRYSSGMVG